MCLTCIPTELFPIFLGWETNQRSVKGHEGKIQEHWFGLVMVLDDILRFLKQGKEWIIINIASTLAYMLVENMSS